LRSSDILISVVDTGPGIPEHRLQKVFEAFVRLPREDGEPKHSAGLSLSIARRRMEAIGGSLEVSSTLGEGSSFELRIPALTEEP